MEKRKKSKNRRTLKEWTKIVEEFHHSGLTQREFCQREGLIVSNLQRWCRRFPSNKESFIDLSTAPTHQEQGSDSASSWLVELELPGGGLLRIRG